MNDKHIGTQKPRREDNSLVKGVAEYTYDSNPDGMLHAAFLRSQYSHAILKNINTEKAEALDDVMGVFTSSDLLESGISGVIRVEGPIPNQIVTDFPILATDRVRYMGEAIAVVVATDKYIARDAIELIDVEYDRLESVAETRLAVNDEAPTIHEEAPDNVVFDWTFGDDEDVDRAFQAADHITEISVSNQRLIGNPIEPRSILADYGPEEELTVTMSTQAPFWVKSHLIDALDLDPADVRVVVPSVGGGFGIKVLDYPEEIIISWCAMELSQPVKWTADRSEAHLADYQSRDLEFEGSLAINDHGQIIGLDTTFHVAVGAYYVMGPSLAANVRMLLSGQYAIPSIRGRAIAAFTNTTPIGSYRGAGRPEAIYFLERLMEESANELDIDPIEFRRINQIPPDAFPYETAVGTTYDSGNYQRAMDRALELINYDHMRKHQTALREEGRFLGIGVSCFVENSGNGPGLSETSRVCVNPSGGITAFLGTQDHGQGHRTTFSQIFADQLEIPYEEIEIVEGDTNQLPSGAGSFGSRSVAVGASAMIHAAEKLKEQAREIAARELEVAPADLKFKRGEFSVTGAPDYSLTLQQVNELAEADGGLEATDVYEPPNYGFSFGTHVAVVEVDPETGEIGFERYVAVDDCGTIINPMIVEGQIHGGVVQGIGQALTEEAVYDDQGTLLTGSFQDYAMPRAINVPEIETEHTVTPCPHNPTGAKGVGESGTIAATPAVVNAVIDALRPFGVTNIEMPLTSEKVWRAINGNAN